MNDKLIDLRNEIIECFTCDEEMMSEEGVLERRIDEVLNIHIIKENNKVAMDKLSNGVSVQHSLKGFEFDDLFNSKLSGKNVELYFKHIVDRELKKFNVVTSVENDKHWHKLIIRTIAGEISISLDMDNKNNRYLWMRLSVNSDESVSPRDGTSCNNNVYFEYTIRNWLLSI